jgi:arginase
MRAFCCVLFAPIPLSPGAFDPLHLRKYAQDHEKSSMSKQVIALVGAPTDIGAGHRGASMGPEALRVAQLAEKLRRRGLEVIDRGNLHGPMNPWQPPEGGYRHLPEVIAWNTAVHGAIHHELQAGRLPIMLGGDHCLAIGSISAVARHCREQGKNLRVLWLDAHADFNTSQVTPSGNIHGMPVACLCGNGPRELVEIGDRVPATSPDVYRQIGIRSVDEGEKRLVREAKMDIYDMRHIDEVGMKRTMEEALEGIDADTRRDGWIEEVDIETHMQMGSLDIVELNPAYDKRNQTAKLAVELVESLFGKSTLMRGTD